MVRVFLGPAGIPITLKERKKSAGTIDGVKYVKEVGLNAMEVEFVQGVKMSRQAAESLGEVARALGVRLSVHAPYFVNLCSEDEGKVEASIRRLEETVDRGELMGATVAVFHAAYYGKFGQAGCYERVKEGVAKVLEWMERERIKRVKLGVEIMGRKSQFGTLEEVFNLVKELGDPRVVPVVDWGHIFARNGGFINYREVIDAWKREFPGEHMHTHFTCVKFKGGEWIDEHQPLDANTPPFEPLAVELSKESDLEITIISESPLLEVDSLKMKEILSKHGISL